MSNSAATLMVQQALELAVQHHEAGRLADAETIYQQILLENPDHPDALHLLGVIAHQLGKSEQAATLISKAVAIKPDLTESHNNLGTVLRELGQLENAEQSYRKALSLKPDYAQAHYNLGNLLHELNRLEGALACHRKALSIMPDYSQAQYSLGVTLQRSGRITEAVNSYQRALELNPDLVAAHSSLGDLLVTLSREEEAATSYQNALQLMPESVELHTNLGLALQKTGLLDEAVVHYRKALSIRSDFPHAHYNLGNALIEMGLVSESVESYKTAISLDPHLFVAHNNLGLALQTIGQADGAISSFLNAISIQPDFTKAYYNLGIIYRNLGKPAESARNLEAAINLDPNFADAHRHLGHTFKDQGRIREASRKIAKARSLEPDNVAWQIEEALFLPVIPSSVDEIDESRNSLAKSIKKLGTSKSTISDPIAEIGTTNFYLAYHDLENIKLMQDIAKLYISLCPKLSYEASHCRTIEKSRTRTLRIGFLSSFFINHTIAKLMHGIIKHLSREYFEVIVFRPNGPEDALSQIVDQSSDKTVILLGKFKRDQERIEKERLDILFYPDIGMSIHTYFLAFCRLAPVQIVSWGHPDTTGIPNVDYFLSSKLLEDVSSSKHYSENLYLLETLPTFYVRPERPNRKFSKSDLGLPTGYRLYLCPQALFKFHPKFDTLLGELLRRDVTGRLILIDDDRSKSWNELLLERFQQSFPDVVTQVLFVPRMNQEEFFTLLSLADAILDIPSFSGGNTSLEAFAMGAPIVTLPGKFLRGRVTAGLYRQMGVTDLIATDSENYLDLALKLAQDKNFKNQMRDKINANSHKLYERHDTVREIETFFLNAYQECNPRSSLNDKVKLKPPS